MATVGGGGALIVLLFPVGEGRLDDLKCACFFTQKKSNTAATAKESEIMWKKMTD